MSSRHGAEDEAKGEGREERLGAIGHEFREDPPSLLLPRHYLG